MRHAARIVPVEAVQPGPTVIDVSDAEALHRVAERFDTSSCTTPGRSEDVFAVRDVDATYRFVVPGATDRRREKPPVHPAAGAPAPEPLGAGTVAAGLVPPDLAGPRPLSSWRQTSVSRDSGAAP